MKRQDLTGQRFGKLTVLGMSDKKGPRGKRQVPLWECRCDCGELSYKATDTLKASRHAMCAKCAGKFCSEQARRSAGFYDGTQLSKIRNMKKPTSNTSGYRGVYWDKGTNKWRARLKIKGKLLNFGSYEDINQAIAARKAAEEEYFGIYFKEETQVY